MAVGDYTGIITVTDTEATNSPQTVSIYLKVYKDGITQVPFGDFASPVDGSTVSNSIPLTGWVLDDIEVRKVEIFSGDTYLGDAVFVEGARPDVEQAYSDYPNNYKAGWGYMLLTHFLPGGGSGTYALSARAIDVEGHPVTLGVKTITVDNTNSVKPFGAIDTPAQGGTAAGHNFINWGWALTAQPNAIPDSGQTIDVYVDGKYLGHPIYNVFRSDIASLFPGYTNSDGAAAYFSFDTTHFSNGVHSIYWIATDDAGNSDGIGSRYFSIENLDNLNSQAAVHTGKYPDKHYLCRELVSIPVKYSEHMQFKKGFGKKRESHELFPGSNGAVGINIKELEPLEILLGKNIAGLQGYVIVGSQLRDLPIGSTLDKKAGKFYWIPGPGYLGTYEIMFIIKEPNGQFYRQQVEIVIEPK